MKLTHKLTLAFVTVSLIAIGLVAVLIWGQFLYEFNRYLQDQRQNEFVAAATAYYEENQKWAGVDAYLRARGLLPPLSEVNPPLQPYVLVGLDRQVLVASPPYLVGEKVKKGEIDKGIPITDNGQVIGVVISTGQPLLRKPIEQKYENQITRSLWLAAIGGTIIAVLLGAFLARSLTRPISEITQATRAMAMGNLEQQVPVRTADELGELAQSFNKMSSEVAHANQSRRQMTADIAHDLRNPLTVISGYLESFQDNRLQPTPERFATMQAEVDNLQRLVEDLRMLSLADSGELVLNLQLVNVLELLEHAANAYQTLANEKNITLSVFVEPGLPLAWLDPDRIGQVLGNLISNALRYTPTGGQITLNASQAGNQLSISVVDNGSGIPSESIPYIFERSYRDDTSRSGSESGLGLAIAKSIVELHGGIIGVETMIGSGTRFWIKMNISPD